MASVLIVDDEKALRLCLSEFLTQGGFTTHAAGTAEEARRLMAALSPDVVLLDLGLERDDGMALARHIRQTAPRCPTIIISGCTDFDTFRALLRLGVFDYLLKPVDWRVVVESVRAAVARKAAEEAERAPQAAMVGCLAAIEGAVARSPASQWAGAPRVPEVLRV